MTRKIMIQNSWGEQFCFASQLHWRNCQIIKPKWHCWWIELTWVSVLFLFTCICCCMSRPLFWLCYVHYYGQIFLLTWICWNKLRHYYPITTQVRLYFDRYISIPLLLFWCCWCIERLHRTIIYPSGFVFYGIWTVAQMFLDPVTRDKVSVLCFSPLPQ